MDTHAEDLFHDIEAGDITVMDALEDIYGDEASNAQTRATNMETMMQIPHECYSECWEWDSGARPTAACQTESNCELLHTFGHPDDLKEGHAENLSARRRRVLRQRRRALEEKRRLEEVPKNCMSIDGTEYCEDLSDALDKQRKLEEWTDVKGVRYLIAARSYNKKRLLNKKHKSQRHRKLAERALAKKPHGNRFVMRTQGKNKRRLVRKHNNMVKNLRSQRRRLGGRKSRGSGRK
jgi:hypothetical protein